MKKMRTIFILDAGALFSLQLLQFFSLDFYIMIVFQDSWYSRYPNALFLVLNIVLTLLFYHTFLNCYKEYKYERSKKTNTAEVVVHKTKYPVYLNCITWTTYVVVLFSKIVLIFSNEVLSLIGYDDFMGPQMLKLLIGLSGIVFYLLVNAECFGRQINREKWPTNAWIVEIFDSVEILSIVISINVSLGYIEYLIYATAFINFLLPVWILYSLSQPDFNSKPMGFPQPICYNFMHLILVQMPFLGIRLYMWVVYNQNASVFMMKNLLHMIFFLHSMYPHVVEISKKNQYSPENGLIECEPEILLTNRKQDEPIAVL
ncbi:uncharacterized protein LOC126895062 [Daktulosphaira vitifoliae]|uniref:uncharacterized protein LOC126895062 n=1 Tax=Daktulosphaira vitifoliae TaxID=58002 RepID=UPI0021A9F6C5|nr:uncharacterized protein LOC126895062 [Daktulosphaira vitifoliae]XP_050522488.1 uncharacterized protein LOC126895062 [Daktulosphaira vitifoliae]